MNGPEANNGYSPAENESGQDSQINHLQEASGATVSFGGYEFSLDQAQQLSRIRPGQDVYAFCERIGLPGQVGHALMKDRRAFDEVLKQAQGSSPQETLRESLSNDLGHEADVVDISETSINGVVHAEGLRDFVLKTFPGLIISFPNNCVEIGEGGTILVNGVLPTVRGKEVPLKLRWGKTVHIKGGYKIVFKKDMTLSFFGDDVRVSDGKRESYLDTNPKKQEYFENLS